MMLREVRKKLLEQHAEIRRLVGAVEQALDQGLDAQELQRRVAVLREVVDAHNDTEATTLKPVLETIDAWGPQRVEQMAAAHRKEHDEVLERIDPSQASHPDALRKLLADLLTHMGTEEKTMLTEKLLRDDVIQLDAGD